MQISRLILKIGFLQIIQIDVSEIFLQIVIPDKKCKLRQMFSTSFSGTIFRKLFSRHFFCRLPCWTPYLQIVTSVGHCC